MMSGINLGPEKTAQTIEFRTDEDDKCVEVNAEDVTIVASPNVLHKGSSKLKIQNIVDYGWEERHYLGQLLAIHMEGQYIAYGIKSKNSPSSSMVRVTNRKTTKRYLIKGLAGVVEDLAFAAVPNKIILACVDTYGTLLVHDITEDSKDISSQLLLHVNQKGEIVPGMSHRVFWCSYIPEDDPSNPSQDSYYDEITRLLAVTRNTTIELWNVETVNSNQGSGPFLGGEVEEGYLEIEAHAGFITDAAFSPDGTAIATASLDGECKFYQVYMHCDGDPRCLHQWKPHGGKPLSALFFLDNHKNHNPDVQFWKYAITGAEFNTELKLWSCETWRCLQTIHFQFRSGSNMKLKAAMDLAAGFVLLSDMFHRVLYVLQLQKDNNETYPFVCSITEFKLPYAILSLAILDANILTSKQNSSFNMEEMTTGDSEDESGGSGGSTVEIKMYLVQPKSLHECDLAFTIPNSTNRVRPLMNDSIRYADELSDVSVENSVTLQEKPSLPQPPINLMTPDAFNSPVKHLSPVAAETTNSLENCATPIIYNNNPDIISPQNDPSSPQEGVIVFTSGGSSPSREVQEILSLQESPPYYMETSQDMEPQTDWIKPQQFTTKSIGTGPDGDGRQNTDTLEKTMASMRADLTTLMQVVKHQSDQIQELKEELRARDEARAVEEGVGRWWDRRRGDIMTQVNSVECSLDQAALLNRITSSLATHIHKSLSPTIATSMEQLKEMMHSELTKKMTTTDQALRDNLGKLARNKSLIETISNTVVNMATPAINQFYQDAFSQSIPTFEKACQNMFEQISETFHKDVAEMEKFSVKASERTREEVVMIEGTASALTQSVQNFTSTIEKAIKRWEENIAEAMSRGARLNNGSVPRSRAVTPALLDSQIVQTQLLNLISQGQFNTAFQQALSAADLSLVMFVCERVSPCNIFTAAGSLLQQHVLLSLIQQLSADMSHHTDLRHRYLEEAVMNLDSSNTATREHMPTVLSALHKQLQLFVGASPGSAMAKRVRMLQMAVHSLLT